MDCEKTRRLLHDYFEGLSSAGEKTLVEEHLASCADCRRFLEDLQRTVLSVKGLDEVEPPAWLTQKVMARIREEQPVRGHLLSRLFGRFSAGIPVAAAATVVIAVFAVVLMRSMQPEIGRRMRPAGEEAQQAPPREAPAVTGSPAGSAARRKTEAHGEIKGRDVSAPGQKDAAEKAAPDRQESAPEPQRLSESHERAGSGVAPAPPAAGKAAGALRQAEMPGETSAPAVAPRADSEGSGVRKKEMKAGRPEGLTYERSVEQRHADGSPETVVTYEASGGVRKKIMEERFDAQGNRHGVQTAYDPAGRPWAEVRYEHGRVDWIREYDAGGRPRQGTSGRPWPWLHPGLH